jgi:DHA3 family tetracycline resistance protein-like MFS transporter
MIGADVARLLALVGLGVLSVGGALEIWHCVALLVLYGAGEAFFQPALVALVPRVVAEEELVQANAVDEFVRPFCMYLAGPAIGGLVVGAFGPGTGFLIDAGTFALGIACIALIRTRPAAPAGARASVRAELREGLAFVRATPWLWGTLTAAAVAMLCFYGPVEVLLPYVVKTEYGGGPEAFGLILAAGGLGSITAAVVMGHRGLPRRSVTVMYAAWITATAAVAGYGIVAATAPAAAVAAVYGVGITVGMVIWRTLMQTHVPRALLGRVASLDTFVSVGLIPVSFALVGPVSAVAGARATLIGGGVLGCAATAGLFLALPRMRAVEGTSGQRGDVLGEAGVGDVGGVHADDLDALARR